MDEQQVLRLIQLQLRFFKQKIGDTPVGAYELVNKLYADTGGRSDVMAYLSTITLDTTKGRLHTTTTINATGNATINASTGGTAGQLLQIAITNDATSGKVITFGTNFKSTGTLTGTTSKIAIVSFTSNGTSWLETGRITGL